METKTAAAAPLPASPGSFAATHAPAPVIDWRRLFANAALGLVGDTGSGKTTLICTYAEYVFERWGKVTRYYSVDPGGFGDLMYSLIIKGIVQVWRMRTRDTDGKLGLPTGTCAQATRGYWPVERDPLTGETRPNVALVAPYAELYTLVCPAGHDVKTSAVQPGAGPALTCPTCKTLTSLANCKEVKKTYQAVGGFDQVGCLAFDSGTAMADWCMVDVDARAGRDELGGEKGAIRTVHSAGEMFGTAGRAGVGFVQNRGQDWIYNAISVPGLVVPPVFTFRKDRGTDNAGLPVHGPKLIGIAKTAEIPGWLGNCFGVEGPGTSPSGRHRLYLAQYKLADNITNLVKHRAAAGLMPDFLEDPEGATIERGDAYTQFNLGAVFEKLVAAVEKTNARTEKMFPNAPGLGSGKVELPEGLVLAEGAGTVQAGAVVGRVAVAAVPARAPQQAQAPQGVVAQAAQVAAVVASAVSKPHAVATRSAVAAPAAPRAAVGGVVPGRAVVQTQPGAAAVVPAGESTAPPPPPERAQEVTVADVAKEMAMPPTLQQAQVAPPAGAPLPPAVAPRGAPPRAPTTAPLKKK